MSSTQQKSIIINKKDWESYFFDKSYFSISKSETFDETTFDRDLKEIDDSLEYDLLEFNLDSKDIILAETLEENGFRLIDSRIGFITLINLETGEYDCPNEHKAYKVRYFRDEDLKAIAGITHQYLTNNAQFVSRYKNHTFFKKEDAKKYFQTWIEFSLKHQQAKTAVLEFNNSVVGFFIFQKKGLYKNETLYKGILSAIKKEHQGKKLHLVLQSFLFIDFIEQQFYLDNTTQLSNYPVVKNHIKSKRKLHKIQLTFMKKK